MVILILFTILQHDIAKAGDDTLRNYENETLADSKTTSSMRSAINAALDAKKAKLNTPFTKYLAIVNPHNGTSFLMEVCIFPLSVGHVSLMVLIMQSLTRALICFFFRF